MPKKLSEMSEEQVRSFMQLLGAATEQVMPDGAMFCCLVFDGEGLAHHVSNCERNELPEAMIEYGQQLAIGGRGRLSEEELTRKLTAAVERINTARQAAGIQSVGSDWEHVKTGDRYYLVDVALRESDLQELVTYAPPGARGRLRFVRPVEQFLRRFRPCAPRR